MRYSFVHYELDTDLHELRRAGETVPLEPLAFTLLTYLVQHRHRTISKEELYERLWPGQYISDGSLVQSVVKARRAIGDNGQEQRCIKTVTGYGYRFIAPVEERAAVSHDTLACAPDAIQPQAPGMLTLRAMASGQREARLEWQKLLATGRIQELTLVQGVPEQADANQGQTVLLVLRLCPTHTAQAQSDAGCTSTATRMWQRCATRPVLQPVLAPQRWKMPGSSPAVAGGGRAGADVPAVHRHWPGGEARGVTSQEEVPCRATPMGMTPRACARR